MTRYGIYLRDASLARIGAVDEYAEFDAELNYNDASTWYLRLPRDTDAGDLLDGWPDAPARGIVVLRDGELLLSGPVRAVLRSQTNDGDELEVSGVDDTGELSNRLALPVPLGPPYTAAEFDAASGTAEDVLRYYVDVNAGPSAAAARRLAGLTAGTTSYIGRAISFVGKSTVDTGASVTRMGWYTPTGAVVGDYLLLAVTSDSTTASVTSEQTNWTTHQDVTHGGSRTRVMGRHVRAGDLGFAFFTSSAPVRTRVLALAYRGVDPTTPVNVSSGRVQASAAAPSALGVTTTFNNTLLVALFLPDTLISGGDVTPPPGFAERIEVTYSQDEASDLPLALAGASGDKTATASAANTWAAALVALTPENPTAGSAVSVQARFDNLLALCQSIAIQGGGLRFKIVQGKLTGTRELVVTRPADRSGEVVFSRELQTLQAAEHENEGPTANYVYAGGGGEGTQREFVERGDTTTIARYWRAEAFVDQRSKTGADLGAAIDETVEKGGPHVGFTVDPNDLETYQFGRDYDLGDVVGIAIGGQGFTGTIRQVSLHLEAGVATVRPVLNPTAAQGRSRGFSVHALNSRLNRVETQSEGFTIGMAMLWTRDSSFIPSGWALCDGTLGTVDLRGRFPIGADPTNAAGRGTYALLSVGGATTTTIAAHSHDLASHVHAGPSHNHDLVGHTHSNNHDHPAGSTGRTDHFSDNVLVSGAGRDRDHDHSFDVPNYTGSTGGPSNNTSGLGGIDNTGGPSNNTSGGDGASTPSILPPYAALHYIQRVST